MNKSLKNRKNRCMVHFYFKISTERQSRVLFVWKLVGLFTAAKWNSFISQESCHPDKPLLNAVKPDLDSGLVPIPHLSSTQLLLLQKFQSAGLWKVLMGHSNSVKNLTNYCNLEPEKSHFDLNHTGLTNLHEYDSFEGLGFHKDYFKIFLRIWNQFAKTAAFS